MQTANIITINLLNIKYNCKKKVIKLIRINLLIRKHTTITMENALLFFPSNQTSSVEISLEVMTSFSCHALSNFITGKCISIYMIFFLSNHILHRSKCFFFLLYIQLTISANINKEMRS